MEHYPDIQRRDGTLFFVLPETTPRAAIATSIERLIDLLDALEDDPDVEANGDEADNSYPDDHLRRFVQWQLEDDEPSLGWPNAGLRANNEMSCDDDREDDNADYEDGADKEPTLGAPNNCGSQEQWAEDGGSLFDECEVENEGGGDILDEPHDGEGDDEPDLGWSGHGTGWRKSDDPRALEADQLGDSELERDDAEHGIADMDALSDPEITIGDSLRFDGLGSNLAKDMIRGISIAAKRLDAYLLAGGRL